jgi:hypothetical protein
MLWPNSVIFLPVTQHWVNTITIYGAAEGPKIQVGGGGAEMLYFKFCVQHIVCVFSYMTVSTVSVQEYPQVGPLHLFLHCDKKCL